VLTREILPANTFLQTNPQPKQEILPKPGLVTASLKPSKTQYTESAK